MAKSGICKYFHIPREKGSFGRVVVVESREPCWCQVAEEPVKEAVRNL